MLSLTQLKDDLVTANRVLAHHHVVDSFGHVSVRNPENPKHFFLSRARAPNCVEAGDITEFTFDGQIVGHNPGKPYSERFIHGAIYEARPDVMAVVHNHSPNVVPFTVQSKKKMRPIMHMCAPIGTDIPTWDIAHKFGATNLLVTSIDMGRDLAATLGKRTVALMRGHGFVLAGLSASDLVRLAVYIPRNARVLMNAMRMGEYKALSRGEIEARLQLDIHSPALKRGWEFWAREVGCAHLLD
jgi:HCOMODA/2-hydroxy-3-carboxy-muconic semialdehyde decarboxylase